MAKARRSFTPEFKVQAVQRVTEQGKSIAEVARDLDLGESLLRSWKTALAAGGVAAFLEACEPASRTAVSSSLRPFGVVGSLDPQSQGLD